MLFATVGGKFKVLLYNVFFPLQDPFQFNLQYYKYLSGYKWVQFDINELIDVKESKEMPRSK